MTNRPDFQALYPTAKTYDEKRIERAEINTLKASWKPKHPRLQALGTAMLLAALLYAWAITMPALVMTAPLPWAFFAALLGLLWVYAAIAGVKRIRALLAQ